jgi:transaldolase
MFKNLNFSLWCDFVEREFLDGEFKELIEKGIINGATSNPAIFENAFKNSNAYKADIERLKGVDSKTLYESLAISDIQKASDALRELYNRKDDGFISLEVDPKLSEDVDETVKEALRLQESVARENLMIKVPATDAGVEAMKILAKEGLHINATLIFSPTQTKKTLEALSHLKSDKKGVVSVFVSRFDRKLDEILPEKGKLGIYNATRIYKLIEESKLENVRTLFASTGVKGDSYPATYYIDELMYENSINTAPLNTIGELIKRDNFELKYPVENYEIDRFFNDLRNVVDINIIYRGLLSEGLKAFKDSFRDILHNL